MHRTFQPRFLAQRYKQILIFITMKPILTILMLSVLSQNSYGQKAMTFGEAEENGISISHLDSIYKSGIHSDTTLAVFITNQDEYIVAYQKLLQDLGEFLKANDFLWENRTKGFNRIYFDKSGKIDFFLYNFRPDQLTDEQENRFKELLNKFITNYRFSLNANIGFAQCSPVTYMPIDK